jgi:hypothetical protein
VVKIFFSELNWIEFVLSNGKGTKFLSWISKASYSILMHDFKRGYGSRGDSLPKKLG